ncbi:Outer membrane protein A [Paraglaciecola mesophila]|uniref:Outer membrane protein A n=1 Tax=Paraglaciecola mesophila TaxID=197222 RepID=A0A857JM19_9ALTE|nr:OmpA family protein [Paraglaciecola mesophila]QHJ12051.1 Outer membrane protein A [Paraglaciecola mesophila]
MPTQGSSNESEHDPQLDQLRKILFGKENQHITGAIRQEARQIVSDVFSEALKDRQDRDGSVKKVMTPLVDKSVEYSVANRKEQFVGYLYPIVGSVVRKSVTAFLTEFIERTNQLLENSLTIKGLSWRFKARQAGVPYANYVASQTFNYRVEQVFLIHRETGLLLNSVAYNQQSSADADLISSMLTAINDFVSDSFKPNADGNEQGLDIVKTDDFTLVLKAGPRAILVAAVTGNMPQRVADQLQLTIEEIHTLYEGSLADFDGNTSVFADCDQQLTDCLVSELKDQARGKKSKPWMAWCILIMLACGTSFYAYKLWLVQGYVNQIQALNKEPGIMLVRAQRDGIQEVKLDVLRDPDAQPISSWLEAHEIPAEAISLTEKRFLSLESQIIQARLRDLLGNYPTIRLTRDGKTLTGELTQQQHHELSAELAQLPGISNPQSLLAPIQVSDKQNLELDTVDSAMTLVKLKINQINSTSVEFASNSTQLSPRAEESLVSLASQAMALLSLAEQAQLDVSFIIIGASDAKGSQSYNEVLSIKRAQAVKNTLQEYGLPSDKLNAIGIGIIDVPNAGNGARKVLFNVITTQASRSNG